MPISPGSRLGQYEIVALIGAGGMGEVYRATDIKLGRSAALKVLPDALASDPDRIARLEREAKVLASLSHVSIAGLFGMDHAEGRHYLAMELVEGETLADRLRRGPLAPAQALDLAIQIAEALEAAHERGIVHRDLKPANIKITPDNRVKVLDFGLAKAVESGVTPANVSNSPTLSMMATQAGLVLGTAAYMSPEQAKGAAADHRSDVFSFGVVLYEMLTCRQPFPGETAPEIMASVLVREPDLSALPPTVGPRLRGLITRCLDKQPKKRWQAVGDLRAEIESIASSPSDLQQAEAAPARTAWWMHAAVVALSVLAGIALAAAFLPSLAPAGPVPVSRFTVPLPEASRVQALGRRMIAVSPDGRAIAFVATGAGRNRTLFLRQLDQLDPRPIVDLPFNAGDFVFSPDGQSVAFFNSGEGLVQRVPVTGGPVQTICKVQAIRGLSWSGDSLWYAEFGKGIARVAAAGGEPAIVVPIEPPADASNPQYIEDANAVLYAVTTDTTEQRWDRAEIVLHDLDDGTRTVVVTGGSNPVYAASGHLLFAVADRLLAVRFDPRSAQLAGSPVPVLEGVLRGAVSTPLSSQFAIARNGTLAFIGGAPPNAGRVIAFVDRGGRVSPVPLAPARYTSVRVSPDGRRLAMDTDENGQMAVWVFDLSAGGVARRLALSGKDSHPVWSPDGRWIAYRSAGQGAEGVFRQRADGVGAAERITQIADGESHFPETWTRDGRALIYRVAKGRASTLWSVSPEAGGRPALVLAAEAGTVVAPALSPDGRWLAYGSDKLNAIGSAYNVLVQPYPGGAGTYQVTTSVSSTPVWAPSGKRLFVAYQDLVFSVDVTASSTLTYGAMVPWPTEGSVPNLADRRRFDVTADDRIVAVYPENTSGARAQQISVVLNWFEELKSRVP